MIVTDSLSTEQANLKFQIKTIDDTLLVITDPEAKATLLDTKYIMQNRLQRLAEQQNAGACTRCLKNPPIDALCLQCRKDLGLEQ